MKQKAQKQIMIDVLKHPAQIHYRDEHIVVLIPNGPDSLRYHLSGVKEFENMPPGLHYTMTDDDPKYVVRTRKDERFLVRLIVREFGESVFRFEYAPNTEVTTIAQYPSLRKAFEKEAKQISYLPLIENQTEDDITAALKTNPANVKFINRLPTKVQLEIIERFPETIEHMHQTIALVRHAIEKTDVSLGKIQSSMCSAFICKRAVQKNPRNIKYVPKHHQTRDMILAAIKKEPSVIREISHPTTEMYAAAAKAGKDGWLFVPESLKKKVRKMI